MNSEIVNALAIENGFPIWCPKHMMGKVVSISDSSEYVDWIRWRGVRTLVNERHTVEYSCGCKRDHTNQRIQT